MDDFVYLKRKDLCRLPHATGIYCFKKNGQLLYIGKAVDIRERVKSHFNSPSYRDVLYVDLVKRVGFIQTNSEIEALLLEAKLIKDFQPKYNILWKDDKNYFYVAVTQEECPRIFITHQSELKTINYKIKTVGPFIEGKPLKKALQSLRRIFPYHTVKNHPKKPCLWCHLKMCPGPDPDVKEYRRNIKKLVEILKGKTGKVLKDFKTEMKKASLSQNYERAAKLRDQIQSLERIMFHAKIFHPFEIEPKGKLSWQEIQSFLKNLLKMKKDISRIEAFDVSNIQGNEATASMVTFVDGYPLKDLYRRFKIKIGGKPNDVAMIKEALIRRFSHSEWGFPDFILIDGGKPQINVALASKPQMPNSEDIRFTSLAKKYNEFFIEGQKEPIMLKSLPREISNLLLRLRDEAHRFAIAYHRKLRLKKLVQ
ncbi:MAG: UvrB/UvrC motif-containing protein [Candidatus Pacebacteria bacterium]|nr:UvrB/UvrC motif-containing protein [Candidatus Paceibacterota bacterium]